MDSLQYFLKITLVQLFSSNYIIETQFVIMRKKHSGHNSFNDHVRSKDRRSYRFAEQDIRNSLYRYCKTPLTSRDYQRKYKCIRNEEKNNVSLTWKLNKRISTLDLLPFTYKSSVALTLFSLRITKFFYYFICCNQYQRIIISLLLLILSGKLFIVVENIVIRQEKWKKYIWHVHS